MSQSDSQLQAKAQACFEEARQSGEAGDFDRAVEAYLEGLRYAPDAVQAGHIELRVLALRRLERGGVKPSDEEIKTRLSEDGTPLDRMLNAEYLLAKDPEHLAYGEALLRAAVAGEYRETAKWIADLMFLANNNARKPAVPLYLLLKDAYAQIGQIKRAAAACQRAARLKPDDEALAAELRRLTARVNALRRKAGAAQKAETGLTGRARHQRSRVASSDEPASTDAERVEATMADADGSEAMAAAKVFFDKAQKAAEGKNFDYAVEMYLEGLRRAPDAVEEGHLPLCELALQRRSQGGRKPSMVERVKRLRGRDPLDQMLNAEYLFAKDPDHLPYAEAMLKAAVEGGCKRTAHWIANLIFQTNNAVEKPSLQTYLLLKDSYRALGQFDKAVAACQRAVRMRPESKELADEFKNLSAELTMSRGKYNVDGGDFRQSIKDRDTQTKLYAQDRVVKTEDYRVSAVEDARRAYAGDPDTPRNLYKLAEALADLETEEAENEAIKLLDDAYESRQDFSFAEKAGQLRIRQAKRRLRAAKKRLKADPADPDAAHRVEQLEAALHQTELEHYGLCVENYPTDLSAKYEYALRLMQNEQYNEAIPLFQEAQRDPRRKIAAMDKIGYCFHMKGWYADAIDVFRRAVEEYEIKDNATAKELRYNLARAHEEQGEKEQALELYRRIAQMDFGFKDVSERVDRLRTDTASGAGS
jgi:tetratricopeptide (TPR) repeat protein